MGVSSFPQTLTLEQLLRDPVVRVMMARDGVDPDEIRALFRRLAQTEAAAPES